MFYITFCATFTGLESLSVGTKKNSYVFLIVLLHLFGFIEEIKCIRICHGMFGFVLA